MKRNLLAALLCISFIFLSAGQYALHQDSTAPLPPWVMVKK